MPEFIFNTRYFRLCKGFVGFDLAFRSDNATVMSCAQDKGIYTIPLVKVLWRDSGKNISSDRNVSIEIKYRKAKATIAFCNWLNAFFIRNSQKNPLSRREERKLALRDIKALYPDYSFKTLGKLLHLFEHLSSNKCLFLYYWIDLFLCIQKRHVKRIGGFLRNYF